MSRLTAPYHVGDRILRLNKIFGQSWEQLYQSDYIQKFRLLSDGSILVYANSLLKSDVNQKNYTSFSLTSSGSDVVKVIAADKNHIYALNSSYNSNFYQSRDAGKNWSIVSDQFIQDITKYGDQVLALASDNKGLKLFSVGNSASLRLINTFAEAQGNCKMYSSPRSVFISCIDGTRYLTHDLIKWTKLNVKMQKAYLDAKNIYISNYAYPASSTIKRSADNGKTWVTLLDELFFGANALTGYHDDENDIVLIAFPHAGIIKTMDGGKNWELINNGLTNYKFNDLITLDKEEYLAATDIGVFYTRDGGKNWIAENNGLTSHYITTLSTANGKLFAGTFGAGVFQANS